MKRWLVVVSYRNEDGRRDVELEFDEVPDLAEIESFWPDKESLIYIVLTESRDRDVLKLRYEKRAADWLCCCEYFGGPFDAIGHC